MEQGIYGFPPGKNITVDYQEFLTSGTWYKPANAKLCFIRGSGGGQGGSGSAGARANGGAPGCSQQFWVSAAKFKHQELVAIGAGSAGAAAGVAANAAAGGATTFAGYIIAGGFGTTSPRCAWTGGSFGNSMGAGGTSGQGGRYNGWGSGGGGGGGDVGVNGAAGGGAKSFDFSTSAATVTQGGGAAGGTVGTPAGSSATQALDNDLYGAGGGGGYGAAGGNGGNGRRGGGGGGAGANAANAGGAGGDGFLNIITYCWE